MEDERRERTAFYAARWPGAIVLPYLGVWPEIDESVFVAPGALVIGNVTIGPESSIWFNTTVRGDIAPIGIGARSSVQDGTVVHVNMDAPTVIGDDVTIGHSALIHGTTIANGSTIGMGAIVLSYSRIGSGVVVAAGALIPERMEVPDGAVMMGIPAKQRDSLSAEQQARIGSIGGRYVNVSRNYLADLRSTVTREQAEQGRDSED
jgi:carbonic anhydrase/acetyltransferase-like protein (isoleucine patch superfamily)